jgi:alpha/beta superfamily hydrolase
MVRAPDAAVGTMPAITTLDERPAYFDANGETLFGIHTIPPRDASESGLIMLPSAERLGYHRNRLGVALAHRLADSGIHAFRIDYRGTGDSTGKAGRFQLDDPFTDDAVAAAAWLRERGVTRHYVAGSCFGARVSVAGALETPSTAGAILLSVPMTDYAAGERASMNSAKQPLPSLAHKALRLKTIRDLRDRDMRRLYGEAVRHKVRRMVRPTPKEEGLEMSPVLLASLKTLVARRVPLFFVYGDTDGAYAEFQEARSSTLGRVLDRAEGPVDIAVVPGRLHGFTSIPGQDAVVELITDWIGKIERDVHRT